MDKNALIFLKKQRSHFIKSRLGGTELEANYLTFKDQLYNQFLSEARYFKFLGLKHFLTGSTVIQLFSQNIATSVSALRHGGNVTLHTLNERSDAQIMAKVTHLHYLYYLGRDSNNKVYIQRATANDLVMTLSHIIHHYTHDKLSKGKLNLLCYRMEVYLKKSAKFDNPNYANSKGMGAFTIMDKLQRKEINTAQQLSAYIDNDHLYQVVEDCINGEMSIGDSDLNRDAIKRIVTKIRKKYHTPQKEVNLDPNDMTNPQNWAVRDVQDHMMLPLFYLLWSKQHFPRLKNKKVMDILTQYKERKDKNKKH